MNNKANEAAQKENEKSTENKLKDMQICDLNRGVAMAVWKSTL